MSAERGELLLEVPGVPVHVGVLWPSGEAARGCGRGDIELRLDPTDGFIWNAAFDADRVDYGQRYDNALHFSPYFRAFEEKLARRLIERYGVRRREVVEIGAGGGHFLGLLCQLGDNRGTGYDPSHEPERADPRLGDRVHVVRDHFSRRYADRPADLVCCRHVLEHLPDPRGFLAELREAFDAQPETILYFEVPNSYPILRGDSIWDLIYEHCNYFVPESLRALFEAAGFEVLDLHETYQGQFVGIEARVGRGAPAAERDLAPLHREAAGFRERFAARRSGWQQRLSALEREGRRAVIWGGGAKAVSFVNLLELDQIQYVVDVNPGKQGSYLAGRGQQIVAPDFLESYRPDVAILMNPVYRDEVAADLARLSPATRLLPV